MTSAAPDAIRFGASPAAAIRVTRSRRPARWTVVIAAAILLALAYLPYVFDQGVTGTLVNVFILLALASMWNLLAGYAGLVSVGQQAYLGLGAYLVLVLAQAGWNPFLAIPVATVVTAAIALPLSWLLFRMRGGYFAIATWVVADATMLVISRFPSLGGGTGASLPGIGDMDPVLRGAWTYWAALAVAAASIAAVYLLLRGRLGLVLTAIRDDETGARSVGARVGLAKRVVYLVSAAGCGAAGGILVVSQLNVQPASAFSVGWSAQMIFVTVIGGIGSIEGPILGTILYFAMQQLLAGFGAWYMIVLGAVAIVVALWLPRGLWGLLAGRMHLRLFPVGYWLWTDGAAPTDGRRRRFGPGRRATGPANGQPGPANGARAPASDHASVSGPASAAPASQEAAGRRRIYRAGFDAGAAEDRGSDPLEATDSDAGGQPS